MPYDFPASPTTGQAYQGWNYDGEKWVSTPNVPNTAGVIGIQVFTASGTYTPSASMTTCVIEVRGGGGGGGGTAATALEAGGGGGQGGRAIYYGTAASIGASQVVTIGAGGTAGTGAASGGTGGTTSVGALASASGGSGGAFTNTSGGTGSGGAGGVGTVGSALFTGQGGGASAAVVSSLYGGIGGGEGGGSQGVNAAGINGANGGGGSGASSSAAARSGGVGGNGYVTITEYGMTALTGTATGAVRYDLSQGLTANQTAQARANIAVTKRNFLINGAFQINQGGYVSGAVLTSPAYGHDQWKAGASGGDYSFTQSTGSTTITIAASKSLIQPIEDVRVGGGGSYVLAWTGTAQARAGVNTLTPSGAYAASPLLITGQTDGAVMSVEFNTGTLGNVSLTEGTVAPPFQLSDYATELALCMRYYQQPMTGFEYFTGSYAYSTTTAVGAYSFKVIMRAAPTITISAASHFACFGTGAATTALTAFTFSGATQGSMRFDTTVASGMTLNQASSVFGNNAGALLKLNARL